MRTGTVHPVALRARTAKEHMRWQQRLRERGLRVPDVNDREYVRSIYFRGTRWTAGVLFAIATDSPDALIAFASMKRVQPLDTRFRYRPG